MDNQQEFIKAIEAYFDDRLTVVERKALEEKVEKDPVLKEKFRIYRESILALKVIERDETRGVIKDIYQQVKIRRLNRIRTYVLMGSIVVVAGILGFILAWMLKPGSSTPDDYLAQDSTRITSPVISQEPGLATRESTGYSESPSPQHTEEASSATPPASNPEASPAEPEEKKTEASEIPRDPFVLADHYFTPYLKGIDKIKDGTWTAGVQAYRKKDFNTSASKFAAYRKLNPGSETATFFLGVSYLGSGDTYKAVRTLMPLLKTNQYQQRARWYLSLAYFRSKMHIQGFGLMEQIKQSKGHYNRKEATAFLEHLK